MKNKTSLLIYEDNACLRESLENLLTNAGEFQVLASFPECSQVEDQVKSFTPDVILMDIDLPGINGIDAVKKIRTFNQQVQIIILTIFDDTSHVFDALYGGANGYLLKKHLSDKLVISIKELMEGGAPMSPTIARLVISNLQQPVVVAKDYQLTSREKEILHLLSGGNSFKMIAAQLNISVDTVRTHIKHIYDKLHVRSQVEAISKALHEKLV